MIETENKVYARRCESHVEALRRAVPGCIEKVEWQCEDQLTITVKLDRLPEAVHYLYYERYGWIPVIVGNDERSLCGRYAVYYLISMEGEDPGWVTVRAEVDGVRLECIVRCKLDSSAESGTTADAEGCTLSHSDVTMAFLGEYFKISLKDADGNRVKGLSWKSGNTGVCTVDADGVVTASGKGTTTVSTTYGGKSFECIIRCNLK